jgi:hypothetical protein
MTEILKNRDMFLPQQQARIILAETIEITTSMINVTEEN